MGPICALQNFHVVMDIQPRPSSFQASAPRRSTPCRRIANRASSQQVPNIVDQIVRRLPVIQLVTDEARPSSAADDCRTLKDFYQLSLPDECDDEIALGLNIGKMMLIGIS